MSGIHAGMKLMTMLLLSKEALMLDILRLKFAPDSPLTKHLLATGGAPLSEGNQWGDRYWGVCNGAGLNGLGELLMQVREERRHK